MDKLKILLVLLVIALAGVGLYSLFWLFAALFKWALIIGAVVLVVGVGAKLLKRGGRQPAQLEDPNADLERADRLLEEIRARQLLK